MKKFLLILVAMIGLFAATNSVSAQTRTKITDGLYLVRYGNTAVIEDEKKQMTYNLSVTREQKSTGEWVYYVACGNQYSKTVLKAALSLAISSAVSSTGVGSVAAGVASKIASLFYDDVCNYFK